MHDDFDPRLGEAEQQRRLDDFEPLVHERRRVDGYLAAHFPLGMIARFVGGDMRQQRQIRDAKRAARSGQDHTGHAVRRMPRQVTPRHALKYRVVLAVDGNDFGAGAMHLIHQKLARHHQGFLVGEQYPLGGADRGKGRQESRGADDRGHDHLHVVPGDGNAQCLDAGFDPRLRSGTLQRRPRLVSGLRVDEYDDIGFEPQRLFHHLLPAAVSPQHRHAKAVRVQADDGKRAAPDAARGTQNGDAADGAHSMTPDPNSPNAYSGAAAVTLSIRSSSPPCPGNRLPLSFNPAPRLNMLSVRSPMTEKTPTAQPNITPAATGRPKCRQPMRATSATAAKPPTAPSQLLPGLTRGANLCRPRLRPAKYAPISAANTKSSIHSTISGPRAKPRAATSTRARAMNAGTKTGTPQNRASAGRCSSGE